MRYKFGIGRLVTMHPTDETGADCKGCTYHCNGNVGKIIKQHRDVFIEGYTVEWDGYNCIFSVEE